MTTHFTNPIHLYRCLLRETTYLFDPQVRSYIHRYVADSFRSKATNTAGRITDQLSYDASHLPTLNERQQLKRGRKFLSLLQRANQGYESPLANVISLAYGRKGRRRRELMATIMTKDAKEDSCSKNMLIEAMRGKDISRPITDSGEFWAPPAHFYALLQSQMRIQSTMDSNRKLRSKPDIPLLNKKGLPMPKCRVKNMTKEWYAKTASVLYPYLEEKEWNELQDRAEGKGFNIPRRRRPASVPVFSQQASTPNSTALHLLTGAVKPMSKKLRVSMGNPHKLTTRYLKRTYTRVLLRNTPKAVASIHGTTLNLHWDYGQKKLPCARITDTGEQAEWLFGSK